MLYLTYRSSVTLGTDDDYNKDNVFFIIMRCDIFQILYFDLVLFWEDTIFRIWGITDINWLLTMTSFLLHRHEHRFETIIFPFPTRTCAPVRGISSQKTAYRWISWPTNVKFGKMKPLICQEHNNSDFELRFLFLSDAMQICDLTWYSQVWLRTFTGLCFCLLILD